MLSVNRISRTNGCIGNTSIVIISSMRSGTPMEEIETPETVSKSRQRSCYCVHRMLIKKKICSICAICSLFCMIALSLCVDAVIVPTLKLLRRAAQVLILLPIDRLIRNIRTQMSTPSLPNKRFRSLGPSSRYTFIYRMRV